MLGEPTNYSDHFLEEVHPQGANRIYHYKSRVSQKQKQTRNKQKQQQKRKNGRSAQIAKHQ